MNQEKMGKFIAELRKKRNMSQNDLAELIPISREAVSKWERGKNCPDSQTLIKLSEIFNVTINELLYGEISNKYNKGDINNVPINLYSNIIKKRKYLFLLIFLLFFTIVAFLIYYFFNTYNSINLYNIAYSSENVSIENGIILTTKEKIYLDIGTITSNNEIKQLELYYKDTQNNKNMIISVDELNIKISDTLGYNEYFDFKNLKYIINNMYLKIIYENETEDIKLDIKKSLANDFLISKSERKVFNLNNQKYSNNIELEKIIKEKFKYVDGNYIYENNDFKITYFKKTKILNLSVTKNNIVKQWDYYSESNYLTFLEFDNKKITNSFSYQNNAIECNIDECVDANDLINYFWSTIDFALT